MYTNSIWTGTKLLNRIRQVACINAGITVSVDDIGLIVPVVDDDKGLYFVVSDNALDRICTVSKNQIQIALDQGKID